MDDKLPKKTHLRVRECETLWELAGLLSVQNFRELHPEEAYEWIESIRDWKK